MDGWICRACWKRNKLSVDRCWNCRTPFGTDLATIERRRQGGRPASTAGAEAAVPDSVVSIPAMVFLLTSWLYRIAAVLILVGAGLSFVADIRFTLAGAAVAMICWIVGVIYRAIANGIRRRATWAFVAGLVLAGLPAVLYAYELTQPAPPLPAALPEAFLTIVTAASVIEIVFATMSAAAAACALLGLVLIVVRPRPRTLAA